MDLYNGYIMDCELGNFRQSERDLLRINPIKCQRLY